MADKAARFRLLPTEFGVVLLSCDAPPDVERGGTQQRSNPHLTFIQQQFTRDSLVRMCPDKDYFVLARVEEIGPVERVKVFDRTIKVCITVADPAQRAAGYRDLVLWDEQTVMAGLFKRGDVVAVAQPYIPRETDANGRYWLEYGSATIIYVLSSDPFQHEETSDTLSQAIQANQPPPPQQQPGPGGAGPGAGPGAGLLAAPGSQGQGPGGMSQAHADCEHRVSRVHIKDLQDGMNHACLVGVVDAVSGNLRHVHAQTGKVTDRLCVRISDGTGSTNIVVWGADGAASAASLGDGLLKDCARLRVGQVAIFDGIRAQADARVRGAQAVAARPSCRFRFLLLDTYNSWRISAIVEGSCKLPTRVPHTGSFDQSGVPTSYSIAT